MIDHAAQEFPIDRSRVVLAGLSAGGIGTIHMLETEALRWDAIRPYVSQQRISKSKQLRTLLQTLTVAGIPVVSWDDANRSHPDNTDRRLLQNNHYCYLSSGDLSPPRA